MLAHPVHNTRRGLLKGKSCDAGGRPLVVAHPSSPTAESFMELGAGLVREVAKMQRLERNAVRWMSQGLLAVIVPGLAGASA